MEFGILKKRNFTKREKERITLYIEAGLAVFLAAALVFAGGADAFTEHETGKEEATSESEKKENPTGEGKEETTADGTSACREDDPSVGFSSGEKDNSSGNGAFYAAEGGYYPIMGESDITVQEMVDYFNDSGETYPSEELSEAARILSKPSAGSIMTSRRRRACARKWHLPRL